MIELALLISFIIWGIRFVISPIYNHFFPPTEEAWNNSSPGEPYPEKYRQHYENKRNN